MSTKMWKVAYGHPSPKEVNAEDPTYPHSDSDGDTIFTNTHFTNEEEAWDKHLREHEAGLSIAARRLEQAKRELVTCEKDAAEAALLVVAVWDARKERDSLAALKAVSA